MSKKSRITRKQKRLDKKKAFKKRDGRVDQSYSDFGAHKHRTLSRERAKLFRKHFEKER